MENIHVGNAPCSWGTLELEGLEGKGIGYRKMLDELVETGYTGTELGDWGFMPTAPETLRAELASRQLTMLGAYVGVALKNPEAHADGQAHALRVARLMSAVANTGDKGHKPFVVLADDNGSDPVRTKNAGRVTPELGLSEAAWRVFSRGAESIARAVKEQTGLRTVFHFHCAGFVETPDEISRFLELTDPSLIGLVFDTGHYAYGSGTNDRRSVPEGLKQFEDRIWYLHLKDCQPWVAQQARDEAWDYLEAVRRGVFCELGQGCVDFPAIASWLRARNHRGWIIVEQDVLPGMGTPKESARRNREYLKTIGL